MSKNPWQSQYVKLPTFSAEAFAAAHAELLEAAKVADLSLRPVHLMSHAQAHRAAMTFLPVPARSTSKSTTAPPEDSK